MASPKLRLLAAVALLMGPLLLGSAPQPCEAQTARTPTLKERLTFGLLAAIPSELAFIDAVVDGVEEGRVPLKLVDRTFFWARDRTPQLRGEFVRRPIIYFQPALEIQLARLDIEIATPRLSFFRRDF